MKKVLTILMAAIMVVSLAACNGNEKTSSSSNEKSSSSTIESSLPSVDENSVSSAEENSLSSGDEKLPSSADAGLPAMAEAEDGFEWYTDTKTGMTFLYPDGWISLSAELFDNEELLASIEEKTGMTADSMSAAFSQVDAIFYDFPGKSEVFTTNMNVIVSPANGFKYEDVSSDGALAKFKTDMGAQYESLGGVEWFIDPKAEVLESGNKTLVYGCSYSMGTIEVSMIQGIVFVDDNIYTFTYSCDKDLYTEDNLTLVHKIIDSLIA